MGKKSYQRSAVSFQREEKIGFGVSGFGFRGRGGREEKRREEKSPSWDAG